MAKFFGVDGFNRLQLGYEVNVNQTERKTFTVSADATDGIYPGDLLIVTAAPQVYKKVNGGAAADYTGKIAGICLATNVKLDPMFPQSAGDVAFKVGDHAACVKRGEVAVKLYGTAPAENAAVYYDITNGAFTTASSNNIACPNMLFTGVTEGNVTVVNVLY